MELTKTAEEQIKELQEQIKALKAAAKSTGITVREPRLTRAKGVTLLTQSKRDARDEALRNEYIKKIRRLEGNPLNLLSQSEVVDCHLGALADLV